MRTYIIKDISIQSEKITNIEKENVDELWTIKIKFVNNITISITFPDYTDFSKNYNNLTNDYYKKKQRS